MQLPALLAQIPAEIEAAPLPRYPATTRDMTLIMDDTIEALGVAHAVGKLDEPLVESIYIFDVFTGPPISDGQKSVSVRITYRSDEATLIDQDVNQLHKRITDSLIKKFKATLPAQEPAG